MYLLGRFIILFIYLSAVSLDRQTTNRSACVVFFGFVFLPFWGCITLLPGEVKQFDHLRFRCIWRGEMMRFAFTSSFRPLQIKRGCPRRQQKQQHSKKTISVSRFSLSPSEKRKMKVKSAIHTYGHRNGNLRIMHPHHSLRRVTGASGSFFLPSNCTAGGRVMGSITFGERIWLGAFGTVG